MLHHDQKRALPFGSPAPQIRMMIVSDRKREKTRGAIDERLVFAIGFVGILVLLACMVILVDRTVAAWTHSDLDRRARLLARALEGSAADDPAQLTRRLNGLTDDRVIGVVICRDADTLATSATLRGRLDCSSDASRAAMSDLSTSINTTVNEERLHLTAQQLDDRTTVVVAQDGGFSWSRRRGILTISLLGAAIALTALVPLLWYSRRASRHTIRESMLDLVEAATVGQAPSSRDVPSDLKPLLRELDEAVGRLRSERKARGELSGPDMLRQLVEERMPQTQLVVVANREPYIHSRDGDDIRVERPASGLVTGIEPLLKACGGVWIGHGGGSADRETSDSKGRLAVPPENPEYVLRRIWLTQREQEGYYYGFSNEGLWPLCHIAHTRPTFRNEDWIEYRKINERFARASVEEAGPKGLILAQDYHYALLPSFIREMAPDSVVSLFWHIPWPNYEVMGICPWTQELLAGMLGADIIGFHTRFHCLNFLDTAARTLECRVDLENMTVEYQGRSTVIKPYPISIDWPGRPATREQGRELRVKYGIPDDVHVIIGVDRADYTKGLIERVHAIEMLLDRHPELVEQFVFVQLAAPSRSHIKAYRDFVSTLESEATRINRKWGRDGWEPIRLSIRGYTPAEVRCHYAMADTALITPLHDGMNLVSKEYVANCTDGEGALVLSRFAGAAKELESALLVNPYDAVDVAEAVHHAITMNPAERRARMEAMRAAVEKNTIYDWSAALLTDMADVWERRHAGWRTEVEATS